LELWRPVLWAELAERLLDLPVEQRLQPLAELEERVDLDQVVPVVPRVLRP
jgi:hypothetical protein